MTRAELDSFAAAWSASGPLRFLNMTMSFPEGDRVLIDLPEVLPAQRGGKGSDAINGGILAAMFDFAIGATALLAPPLRRNATVHMSIDYQRAVRGNSARCIARLDRATRALAFASAEILDEHGTACSRATGLVSLGDPVDLATWSGSISSYV